MYGQYRTNQGNNSVACAVGKKTDYFSLLAMLPRGNPCRATPVGTYGRLCLYFEGERYQNFRILRGVKNRFGATNEIGILPWNPMGCRMFKTSALFLSRQPSGIAGSAVVPSMEEAALLVEIQGLVTPSYFGVPRRLHRARSQSRGHHHSRFGKEPVYNCMTVIFLSM